MFVAFSGLRGRLFRDARGASLINSVVARVNVLCSGDIRSYPYSDIARHFSDQRPILTERLAWAHAEPLEYLHQRTETRECRLEHVGADEGG